MKETQLSERELQRFSRHLLIREIGEAGQKKLEQSSVLIVGAGGLGSPAALYLAAAGVGRIGIVDDDLVEISNLQRQIIHSEDTIGQPKVNSAKAKLLSINSDLIVDTFHTRFAAENGKSMAAGYDLLISATDNFAARIVENRICVDLGMPYIYGSAQGFDGHVSVFIGKPCYQCVFPTQPTSGTVQSPSESGVLGPVPGIIGSIQAAEAIKVLLKIGEPLTGRLLIFNALTMSFNTITLKNNPECPVCG